VFSGKLRLLKTNLMERDVACQMRPKALILAVLVDDAGEDVLTCILSRKASGEAPLDQ
jgi:hypothetical protein